MSSHEWTLIGLALLSVAMLVVLVTWLKINAFIALALASLVVGAGAVFMGGPASPSPLPGGGPQIRTLADAVAAFGAGMGATLGSIAAVIGLGTMLGKLLAESGGAEVLAKRFNRFFGPAGAVWCVLALALVVGLATWFAVGLVLLAPILLTLTRESKQPFITLALPLLAGLSIMHGLTPPHPGPVVAIEQLKANTGMVLVWAFVIGIPTALIAGPLFARWASTRVSVSAPTLPVQDEKPRAAPRLPGFMMTCLSILLPVILMLVATVAELILPGGSPARATCAFIGNPTIALMISVLFASWSLGTACGYQRADVLKFTEQSIAAVGMTLLVVGGGGGFARVLKESGVASALGAMASSAHLPPLLFGWLVAVFIRVATGSATVAITTAVGLMGPIIESHSNVNRELLVVAIGCGSLFLSHLNDGGFWIVKDTLGLSVGQTLRTWTVMETIISIVGMLLACLISAWV